MKKLILFLTILMVLSPLALSLRAAEVTWSASTYMTAQNITANGTAADGTSINVNDYIIFSINKNDMSGSSVPVWYPNDPSLRFYRPTGSSTIGNSLDFALTGITVTAITMVCQNTDKPEMELKVDGSVYATTAVGADKSVSFSGFSALSSLSLRATSAGGKNGRLSTITVTYTINSSNTVATPSITPLSGNYAVPFTALITCEDDHHSYPPHAVFWYTTDNFVSTPNDTAHPISVEISGTTTLKAWAVEGNVSTGLNYSDTVTRVYTFPTSLANVAAFNAADVDDFVSIAGLSVIRHSVNNLWATDGTNAIHAYGLSTARAVLNDGDVISLAGDRANYNGFPEMTNPVLLTSISGTPVTPVDDFDILSATTADFGKFVTVKNVKFASASALENGVAVTNQLMDLSTIDSQKNYDITGVINYNNSTLQFLPTAVAEVQPLPIDSCVKTLPFVENFNDITPTATTVSGNLPDCWVSFTNNTSYTAPHVIAATGYSPSQGSGTNYLIFINGIAGTNSYAVLPEIGNINSAKFSAKVRKESTGSLFRLGYVTDASSIEQVAATFVVIDTLGSSSIPYQKVLQGLNIPDGARLAFSNYHTNSYYGVGVDDIEITELVPNDVAAVGILAPNNAVALSSAETVKVVVKNNGTGPITALNLTLEVDGTLIGTSNITGCNITPEANDTLELTDYANLSVTGSHTIRVWANLTGDNNRTNDTVSKTVTHYGCGDIPYQNPFSASVDTAGIKIFNENTDDKTWQYDQGSQTMRYAYHGSNAADDWFITKCIHLEAGKNYSVSFNYRCNNNTKPEKLKVYYGIAQTVGAMTELIADFPNIIQMGYQLSNAIITPTVSGEYYFGFYAYSEANMSQLFIDNLNIAEVVANDVEVLTITAPVASGISFSNAEVVKVAVKNNGSNIITALDLTLEVDGNVVVTSNITGRNIAYNTNDTLTFDIFADLSLAGDHSLRVWADLSGDANHANDTASKVVNNFIFACGNTPYENQFTDWRDTMGIKIFNVNSDNKTWNWSTAGYMQYQYHFDNAADDWFITKCIHLETGKAYKLSFAYKAQGYEEKFAVAYGSEQTVAGMTNQLLDIAESGNVYKSASAVLTPAATGEYYIGFHCYSAADKFNLTIDSLRLVEYDMTDAALIAITAPVSGPNLSNSEIVTVKIKNNGSVPILSADLALVVNETSPVVESFSGNIAAGAEHEFSFSTPLDLSAAGYTSLKAYITMTGDMDNSNDTAAATVVNTICNTEALTFEPDLATLSACWTTTGNDVFVLNPAGTATLPIPAHTGDFLGYNADGVGSDGKTADISLITPPIDCSAAAAVKLSFNYFAMICTFDVKVSIDNAPFVLVQTLTNQYAEFYPVELNLTGAAGSSNVRVAFHFNEGSTYGYGAGFQNVKVFAPAPNDVGVLSIVSPVSGISLSASETVEVLVKNSGTAAITSLDLSLEVDGNFIGTENITSLNIAADATDTVTLTNVFANLSVAGEHSIRVWADLSGDANQTNDTTSKNVVNTVCNIIDQLPWDENFNTAEAIACWTINSTVSPTNSWKLKVDNTNGGYSLYTLGYASGVMFDETIISPEFDFTNYPDPVLSFNLKGSASWLGEPHSSLTIEVSINGAAFIPIWSEADVTLISEYEITPVDKSLTGCGGAANVKFAFHYTGDDGAELYIDNLKISYPTSVNQNLVDGSFSVYPNPVKDVLTINGMDVKNAEIYDITGKLVMSGINKNIIDVKSLNIGVYFLKIDNQVAKFVKE